MDSFDVVIAGAGLAGLVAAVELADAGRRVAVLEQEGEANLGGQAWWSFGGLFLVDSPEQRRMGIRDSRELAWRDWLATAAFDREDDLWPRRWAEAYVDFAAGEKRAWLRERGLRLFPVVGWAERGLGAADGPGNSVPRFHITWGTGPGVVEPFAARAREHARAGRLALRFRHRVTELAVTNGVATGVRGEVLEPDPAGRGRASSRVATGAFEVGAQAVLIASGGIGGDLELVRRHWPTQRLGPPPATMRTGVPAYVDGRLQAAAAAAGARLIHPDRMWCYTEGVRDHSPVWPGHGIRILPDPSPLWLDPDGRRLPAPHLPGGSTLDTLAHVGRAGHPHTWFLLDRRTLRKGFALSGSEQDPDLTGRSVRRLVMGRLAGLQPPVRAFLERGEDFLQADDLRSLAVAMNALTGGERIDADRLRATVEARDAQLRNRATKDAQLMQVRNALRSLPDRLVRVVPPRPLLAPDAGPEGRAGPGGPLVAVRLHVLTRKTLGGLETDLEGRALRPDGEPLPGLYAAGEVAGFGGGGMHGYRSLEGTFLGGCLFSGRTAGRAIHRALG